MGVAGVLGAALLCAIHGATVENISRTEMGSSQPHLRHAMNLVTAKSISAMGI
jgi:Photosynthetic reaction centre protein